MATKEIKFTIELDENNHPRKIEWEATDAGFQGKKACSSMLISMWDKEAQNSMNIDLWTKEMMIPHMNVHMIHTLMHLSDVFRRATRNTAAAEMIKQFAHEFAAKLKQDSLG